MVAVGLTPVEPLADVELNAPGEIEIVVAPLVVQLSVVLVPELMVAGLAANDTIEGMEPLPGGVFTVAAVPAQLLKPKQASKTRTSAWKSKRVEWHPRKLRFLTQKHLGIAKLNPCVGIACSLEAAHFRRLLAEGTESGPLAFPRRRKVGGFANRVYSVGQPG